MGESVSDISGFVHALVLCNAAALAGTDAVQCLVKGSKVADEVCSEIGPMRRELLCMTDVRRMPG